jgi:hypothetical protein
MHAVTVRSAFRPSRQRNAARPPTLPTVATETEASATRTSDPGKAAKAEPPTRISTMLALAYFVDRQIEAGSIKDYAKAARLLRISRARMTHVQALLSLSPRIQKAILFGTVRLSERRLRPLLREASWQAQDVLLATLAAKTRTAGR